MNDIDPKFKECSAQAQQPTEATGSSPKPQWATPIMEDVSEQVMAQPYIRFT